MCEYSESDLEPEGDESLAPPVSADLTLQLEQELLKSKFKIPVVSELNLDISLKDFVMLFVQVLFAPSCVCRGRVSLCPDLS